MISLPEIVTIALYHLGGADEFVDTEDVAVRAHKLAPERFSWRRHSGQINLELVRVSLSDAKKSSKGEYVSGSGTRGWRLTRKGLDFAEQRLARKETEKINTVSSGRRGPTELRIDREKSRLVSTNAYKRWVKGQVISVREAEEALRINNYLDAEMRESKITRALNLFSKHELKPFISALAELLESN
jgi:hypothetical protein